MPAGLGLEAQAWSNRGLLIAITFFNACKNSSVLQRRIRETSFLSIRNISFKKELYYLLIKERKEWSFEVLSSLNRIAIK